MLSHTHHTRKALDLSMYLVASRNERNNDEFLRALELALQGGVDIIQLREKSASSREFYALACKVKALADRYAKPLLINDRIDIALACGADGAHIGISDDLPPAVARKILGKDKILGLSLRRAEDLPSAQGVDYLGVGAVFETGSKSDSVVIGTQGLREVVSAVQRDQIGRASQVGQAGLANQAGQAGADSAICESLPIVAIGGINQQNIAKLAGINIAGIAVISAIMNAQDPKTATKALRQAFLNLPKTN